MMTILITGASAGFGKETCRVLIQSGFNVVGAARRLEKLKELATELGENFYPLQMDMTDNASIDNALKQLPEKFATIDVLINNAGLALSLSPANEVDFADWETMIKTNIVGLTYLTHEIVPQMVKRNHGMIINLGSVAGNYPYPGNSIYGATKAFVKQFSLNLRADLSDYNIRVTNIEPGLCGDTEFSYVRFKNDEKRAQSVYENIDYIQPIDIANTILWIINQPQRVNINRIEIMPTKQTFSALRVIKDSVK